MAKALRYFDAWYDPNVALTSIEPKQNFDSMGSHGNNKKDKIN